MGLEWWLPSIGPSSGRKTDNPLGVALLQGADMMQKLDESMSEGIQRQGHILAVYVAEAAGVEMHALDEARLVAGVGIEGDRYTTGHGHYSQLWHPDRQLTLIEQEVIDEVAAAIGQPVHGSELRRNIVTAGVALNELVGSTFSLGEVVVYGGRLNVPCRYLERLIDKKVFEPLLGCSGLNCQILCSGKIRPGDTIRTLSVNECAAMSELVEVAR